MSQCATEACEREPTHYVEYPTSNGFFTGTVCIPCLYALESGMDANVSDRQQMEIECL